MEQEFNILYDYDLEMHCAYLASFLQNIQMDSSVGTIFKINKITIVQQYSQYEMIHLIKFSSNLSIDELCQFFNINFLNIRYRPPNYRTRKQLACDRWTQNKKNPIVLEIFENPVFFKHYSANNICDIFNLERAFRYNSKVGQLIELHYYKRDDIIEYFSSSDELNLNDLLRKLNRTQFSIYDFEELLQQFGSHFKKIVIDNFEETVPISFFVRRKVNLILIFIERHCPEIEEIIIDSEIHMPLDTDCKLNNDANALHLCKTTLSVYAGHNETERILQILNSTDIFFQVRKIKNFKLKFNKKIKKIMKLGFPSEPAETLALMRGVIKPEFFPSFQIAFEWHQDGPGGNSWKGIRIAKSMKNYISYMFTELKLLRYYNLFDLLFLDDAFYDIENLNKHLIYNQILLLRPSLINLTTGEFDLNKILLNFNLTKIGFKSFIKILRIFGESIQIFIASKSLIDFPEIYNSDPISYLNIILYYLRKYCKNLTNIKFDDTILDGKLFNKNQIKLKKLIVTNYNANDLFELFDDGGNNYNEIDIKKFTNLTEKDFVKTLLIKNLSKLILNSNYTGIINWAFLQDTEHLKLDKFHLDSTFEITLYNLMYNLFQFHTACDTFLDAIIKFFKNYNANGNSILSLSLNKCTIKCFKLFNLVNLERIVFNGVDLTIPNLIELGKCCNIKSVTFNNCDMLQDEYLMVYIKNLTYNTLKEINVESCFITNAFFYQFAAYQSARFGFRIFQFWFSMIKFSFKKCSRITIDWEYEEFAISNDDTYISMMPEFEENNRVPYDEQDKNLLDFNKDYVCDEDESETEQHSDDYDFYN